MSETQWRRVSPLSVVFYLAELGRTAARQIIQLAVPAAAVMASTGGFTVGRLYAFGVFVALLAATVAVARYATFRYCIGEQSIIIRSGVLSKNQLNIQYDRIQAINDSQNLIYRLFNLVNLQLDTPGSNESEAHLPAVAPQIAAQLREKVQAAGSRHAGSPKSPQTETASAASAVIHSLGTLDMLKIGLSSRRVLVLFAVIPWLWDTLGERLASSNTPQRVVSSALDSLESTTGLSGAGSAAVAVVTAVLALAALSVAAAMLRFNGFKLLQSGGSFTSRAGLLTVRSHAVATRKIQCLNVRQSIMLGVFAGTRITAFPAASHRQEGGPFVIPIASRTMATGLAHQLWGDDCQTLSLLPDTGHYQPVDSRYRTYLFIRHGLLPAFGVAGLLLAFADYTPGQLLAGAAAGSLWLIATAIGAHLKYRRLGVQIHGNDIALRRGLIGWQIDSFPARKVQSLDIHQTVLQRRRGLANLKLSLASRTLVIPYVNLQWAESLAEQILQAIAADQRPWI